MAKRKTPTRTRPVQTIPKGRRVDVTRGEFNRVIDLLNQRGEILNKLLRSQEIQLQRIAQLQAEVDGLKRAVIQKRLQP